MSRGNKNKITNTSALCVRAREDVLNLPRNYQFTRRFLRKFVAIVCKLFVKHRILRRKLVVSVEKFKSRNSRIPRANDYWHARDFARGTANRARFRAGRREKNKRTRQSFALGLRTKTNGEFTASRFSAEDRAEKR